MSQAQDRRSEWRKGKDPVFTEQVPAGFHGTGLPTSLCGEVRIAHFNLVNIEAEKGEPRLCLTLRAFVTQSC